MEARRPSIAQWLSTSPTDSRPLWPFVTIVALKGIDFYQTADGLYKWVPETNPLYAWANESAGLVGIFVVATALTAVMLYLMHRSGRFWRAAFLLAAAPTMLALVNNFLLING